MLLAAVLAAAWLAPSGAADAILPAGTPIAEGEAETEEVREEPRASTILRPDRWAYSGPESRGRFFATPARRTAPKARAAAIGASRMAARSRPSPRAIDEVARAQYQVASETTHSPVEPALSDEAYVDLDDPSIVEDPPVSYSGPPPSQVEDIEARDGPRIPEPMVFDLVRGLGARRGELEINVLGLAPIGRRGSHFDWAPEIEYAVRDGLAVEFELPIFGTRIQAAKAAVQYTFGTALDDAFIHGAQGILYYDMTNGRWSPTALYLAGIRFDKTWSLLGMVGGTVGEQIFPFSEGPSTVGTDIITNLTLFADVTDDLVFGVETNLSRQLRGPSVLLFMPQVHWKISEHVRLQFGVGMRDDIEGRHAELGFRAIWER